MSMSLNSNRPNAKRCSAVYECHLFFTEGKQSFSYPSCTVNISRTGQDEAIWGHFSVYNERWTECLSCVLTLCESGVFSLTLSTDRGMVQLGHRGLSSSSFLSENRKRDIYCRWEERTESKMRGSVGEKGSRGQSTRQENQRRGGLRKDHERRWKKSSEMLRQRGETEWRVEKGNKRVNSRKRGDRER